MTVIEERDGDAWIFTMDGAISELELAGWLLRLDEIARPSRRFAVLVDVRWTVGWNAAHTRRVRAWIRGRGELLARLCDGFAFVADSPFSRGAMRALFGLSDEAVFAYTICSRREQADSWIAARLKAGASEASRAAG